MPTYLPIVFTISLVIITVTLAGVGVYLIIVLNELRQTLNKANKTIDQIDDKFENIVSPLKSLGGLAAGLGTGLKVFEAFVSWLKKSKSDDE